MFWVELLKLLHFHQLVAVSVTVGAEQAVYSAFFFSFFGLK